MKTDEELLHDILVAHRGRGCNATQRAMAKTILTLQRRLGDVPQPVPQIDAVCQLTLFREPTPDA